MTVKQFFKGTAFKCIAVLTCVLLISGVLLAICWGFLEVTDEERFNRKIGSVYGGETVTSVEQDLSGKNTKAGDATIEKMWFIEEKNDYLVQASSRGYNGNITCWIAVNMNDTKTEVVGLGKVILFAVGDPAELTGNIPSDLYDKFAAEYAYGKTFEYGYAEDGSHGSEYIGTGATSTMTAICNDVNGAVSFVKAYASGGDIANPFEGYEYADNIAEETLSHITVSGTAVSYEITTKTGLTQNTFKINITVDKVDGTTKITSYEIVKNGSSPVFPGNDTDYSTLMSDTAKNLNGKTLADIQGYLADTSANGVLHTGATNSNTLCYQSAAFALANYDKVLSEYSQGGNA